MLKIRPHLRTDIPLRVKWRNNPLVSFFIEDEPNQKTNLKKETQWFDEYSKNRQKKFFTMCVDNVPIGFMGLSNIDLTNQNADLFIAIGEDDYRGRGLGKQSLSWLLNYAFHKLKLHKVNLEVIDVNTHAIKVYKELGFVIEGRKREEVFIKGKWISMLEMAIFKKNWK
jgi:UDP-4-amino-4,6-dideoxy-N-acetyl-beta-L-altrosamine N-acetyltransferase